MSTHWVEWHRDYDDPTSSLARRLEVVRTGLCRALEKRPVARLISICAGDGRDALPVLAERGRHVDALLVELDPTLAARARDAAAALELNRVVVRTTDAGVSDAYLDSDPAQVVLACGIFGNVPLADAATTIAALPGLLDARGVVIWTRGRGEAGPDPAEDIRALFAQHGFSELSFTAPTDAPFRVGVHQLESPPTRLTPGQRLFQFS